MVALEALDVMREGHDCSGVGIFLRDLAGPFEDIKDAPILSGIFSDKGLRRLDTFMMDVGFMTKYKISIKVPKTPPPCRGKAIPIGQVFRLGQFHRAFDLQLSLFHGHFSAGQRFFHEKL